MAEPLLLTTSLLPPLVITPTGPNSYTVRCGDRYENELDSGEALWVASAYLHNKAPRYLKTDAEHAAFWKALEMDAPPREFL